MATKPTLRPMPIRKYTAAGYSEAGVSSLIDAEEFNKLGVKPKFTAKQRADIIKKADGCRTAEDLQLIIQAGR
jgi:hypothetical protein